VSRLSDRISNVAAKQPSHRQLAGLLQEALTSHFGTDADGKLIGGVDSVFLSLGLMDLLRRVRMLRDVSTAVALADELAWEDPLTAKRLVDRLK
jgi:hypothetical protein